MLAPLHVVHYWADLVGEECMGLYKTKSVTGQWRFKIPILQNVTIKIIIALYIYIYMCFAILLQKSRLRIFYNITNVGGKENQNVFDFDSEL